MFWKCFLIEPVTSHARETQLLIPFYYQYYHYYYDYDYDYCYYYY